jgi:outer membrane receptor protein involved in Fe transport
MVTVLRGAMRNYCLFLALVPSTAFADTGEIIVTGRALPEASGDAAYSSVTINRERLTNVASGRAEDVLRDVAGLQQFRRSDSRSANATAQGVTLRGLGGNASSRALVLLDGVPQSDPFGGSVTFPALNLSRIGDIRITRGGGSGTFGPGAIAGTIALSSIGPETSGTSADIGYGSRDAIEAGGVVSGALGAGFAFIAADYARGDGFIPIIASQRGPADWPARYEQASLAVRGVVPIGQTELQASISGFTDRRDRGLAFTNNGSDGADASLRLVNSGRWAWEALAYVQVRAFMSQASSVDAARAISTQTLDQFNIPSTGIGARFELRPPFGETVTVRLGGDARRVNGTTREFFTFVGGAPTRGRIAGGENDTAGVFAEASAVFGALTLTGGGRIDFYTIRDGRLLENTLGTGATLRADRFATRKGNEPTARAGISYALTPTLNLRSAAYLGWRLPTLNELYRPFRIGADATAANAALKTERVRGVEAGIGWQPFEGAKLGAILFTNRLEDAIANVTIARGPGTFPGVGFVSGAGVFRQRQNLDAIRSNGVELDANITAGDWRAQASYAYTDATVRSSGIAAGLNGLRPAQVARHNASATLGWRGLSLTARYVGPQFEDDQNLRHLRSAVTLDGVVNIPIGRGLAVSLRAENITNTRIEAGISATGVIERASPRTLWLGLRWADSR